MQTELRPETEGVLLLDQNQSAVVRASVPLVAKTGESE